MKISVPEEVRFIIDTLEKSGYDAYAVGGCVRDALLGLEPSDWDICTRATPEQTAKSFEGVRIIETGLRHGTLTLLLNNRPFEITTFRVDGVYSDGRRPDKVEFTDDLKADLSRRDFTINAMAYNPEKGVVDFFGGISDIEKRTIRCVGDADERFREDALRILRALRMASVMGFAIEPETSAALCRNTGLLKNISAERIAAELDKLLVGKYAGDVLLTYAPTVREIIPEAGGMMDFGQDNPNQHSQLWRHTAKAVSAVPAGRVLRLALLLHDIANPHSHGKTDPAVHFTSHAQMSSSMAKEILSRLKYDNETIETVAQLILYHETDIPPERKHIKRWLNRMGEEKLRMLIEIKKADATARLKKPNAEKISELSGILSLVDAIIEQRQCFSWRDLAINGKDLIAAGIPEGPHIGRTLDRLLELVIDETVENDREKLLEIALM